MEPGFNEKIDTLDLIINALKDHEKRLDAISERLENLVKGQSTEARETERAVEQKIDHPTAKKVPLIVCSKWDEFKKVSKDAKIVAYEVEDSFFYAYSMVGEEVFRYSEDLPNRKLKVVEDQSAFRIDKTSLGNIELLQFLITRRLRCGLSLSMKISRTALSEKQFLFELNYDFDDDLVREFLSGELNVSQSSIVEGKITY